MGRLTNATGVRLGLFSNWKNQNASFLSDNFIGNHRFSNYIELLCNSAFNSEKLGKAFNFLIGSIDIESRVGHTVITIGVYDGGFVDNPGSKLHSYVLENKLSLLERIVLESASKIFPKQVKVKFYLIKNSDITALLLANYIQIKLYQNFTVNEIIFSLRSMLNNNTGVLGYRIDFSGRFTRKQRASFLSFKGGQVSFSTRNILLDYSETSAVLKYGKCGIKVWLHQDSSNLDKQRKMFRNASS